MALLTIFFEMLLPKGELQRFARVVTGLLVLLALLNPILGLFHKEAVFPAAALPAADESRGILEAGEALRQNLNQNVMADYEKEVAGQMAALVNLTPGVSDAQVETVLDENGHISQVSVTVQGTQELTDVTVLKDKICQLLISFYHVEAEDIDIFISKRKDDSDGRRERETGQIRRFKNYLTTEKTLVEASHFINSRGLFYGYSS